MPQRIKEYNISILAISSPSPISWRYPFRTTELHIKILGANLERIINKSPMGFVTPEVKNP
jgi:hypothetical protein